MVTFYVTYATSIGGEFVRMPHTIRIHQIDELSARRDFGRLFRKCFGQSIDYKIINVTTN